jgi:glutaminyl-peptide cyclotransferase
MSRRTHNTLSAAALFAAALAFLGCGGSETVTSQASASSPAASAPPQAAPPADSTGGFDGQRAYQHVAALVGFGPHSAGSDGDRKVQSYIITQLKSFGCPVDEEDFHTPTPIGNVAMKNILVKIPGASPDILLYASHYDSAPSDGEGNLLPTFVGADDGGSSTGVLLEFARLVCSRKNAMTIWLAFLDGEEAFRVWSDTDSTYGSRELAARMAVAGDLSHTKAMILVDMVGDFPLQIFRESNSTSWLADIFWTKAAQLGHQNVFVPQNTGGIDDDHILFLNRKIPALDIIEYDDRPSSDAKGHRIRNNFAFPPYWHTTADTLDKVSPLSLAVVGHVLIEALPPLEQKFHPAK